MEAPSSWQDRVYTQQLCLLLVGIRWFYGANLKVGQRNAAGIIV
jgi:hypothetical protein